MMARHTGFKTILTMSVLLLVGCGGSGKAPDKTSPVIALVGENPQVIAVGEAYGELGATASDNRDGDLTASIVIDASAIDTSVPGTYQVFYEVSDAAGNEVAIYRTVHVRDLQPPEITLLGDQLQTILVSDPYVELGVTATDNIDGDLTDQVVVDTAAVNLSISGTYEIRYMVSDSSGNLATASRSVRVLVTGAWTVTEAEISFDRPGREVAAVLLEDGRALVIGNTMWTYDPGSEVIDEVGTLNHYGYATTMLRDGRVLITGGDEEGYDYVGPGSKLALLFDPADSSLTEVGPLLEQRRGHSATLLENGQVLIAGGLRTVSGFVEYLESTELFDPATNLFVTTGSLNSARFGHTATRLADGSVFIAGGVRDHTSVLNTETYQPADGSFSSTAVMPGDGRWLHTANLLPTGKVLIAGGIPGWREYYDPWEFQASFLYEPSNDSFVAVGEPDIKASEHFAVSMPSTANCPGPVLLGTGADGWKSTTDSVLVFDPVIEQFYSTEKLGFQRTGAAATVLEDGRVLVSGGRHPDIFEPRGMCN